MNTQRFDCVWDAIEDTPEEAAEMRRRSLLMMSLNDYIERNRLSRQKAAEKLGVTQQQISDLQRGHISALELDILTKMAAAADLPLEAA